MTIFQSVRKGLLPARLSVADVYALTEAGVLSEDDDFELIDGEIVPVAAAKASPHERMKSKLNRALVIGAPKGAGIFIESSITLDVATLVEPDLAVWSAETGSQDVRGPDLMLLVEVASSSIAYDLTVKARLYARYGVREYWVVDALRETVRVHRAPSPEGYTDVEEYEAHDAVTALLLPEVTIRLDRLD